LERVNANFNLANFEVAGFALFLSLLINLLFLKTITRKELWQR
jgi:hypothetical protein